MPITEILVYGFLFVLLYFQVFLIISFFFKKKEPASESLSLGKLPSVTVIVPCYNEETTLTRTVESLLALNYPKERLSIFLINDGSTDNTLSVMNQFKTGYPQISVFDKANSGKWQTLNYGLKRAKSDLVGCLDADSFVDSEALMEIVKCFASNKNNMAVTPTIRIFEPNSLIRKIQNAEYDLGTFVRKTLSYLGAIHITPGPFSIFKREVFKQVGNYRHAHNTEDFEIALRMQKAKMKIDNAHKAVVYTVGPKTVKALYKQRVRWTGGFLQNIVDYRKMLFSREQGILGFYILPMTILTVLGTVYFVTLGLVNWSLRTYDKIYNLSLVNYDIVRKPFEFNLGFDWFFVNTDAMYFIGLSLMLVTLIFILLGRYLSSDKKYITLDVVYFMTLYSFIAPFWLFKSIYNTLSSKEAKWR